MVKSENSETEETKYDSPAKTRYLRHLTAAQNLEKDGLNLYEVCLAKEYADVVYSTLKKLGRAVASKETLQRDMYDLYMVVLKAFSVSHGTSTPREMAEAVVSAYMHMGMDVSKTLAFTRTAAFALWEP